MGQFNPQDFRWSLIEHPQSTAMVKPEDSNWISFRQPVRIIMAGTFSDSLVFSLTGSGSYTLVNTAVLALAGTDYGTTSLSLGNIDTYNIWNFIDPPRHTMVAFGTHFFTVIPTAGGTDYGTHYTTAFGTHLSVSVLLDAGTALGTHVAVPYGTHLLVSQIADAGTNIMGTWHTTTFGTALQVIFTANAGTNVIGTWTTTPFGTYAE